VMEKLDWEGRVPCSVLEGLNNVYGEQPDIVEDMSALIDDWKFEGFHVGGDCSEYAN